MKKKRQRKTINIVTYLVATIFLIGVSFFLRELYLNFNTPCVSSEILKEAEKYIPNYDYIVCLDNMKLVWVNDKTAQLFGYSADEKLGVKNYEFLDERYGKKTFLSEVLERAAKQEGEFSIVVPTKNNENLLVDVEYHTFEYKKEGYYAGKVVNSVEISEKEAEQYYSN